MIDWMYTKKVDKYDIIKTIKNIQVRREKNVRENNKIHLRIQANNCQFVSLRKDIHTDKSRIWNIP